MYTREELIGDHPNAISALSAWVERERREEGMIEMAFVKGSDENICTEEGALQTLALLRYVEPGLPNEIAPEFHY